MSMKALILCFLVSAILYGLVQVSSLCGLVQCRNHAPVASTPATTANYMDENVKMSEPDREMPRPPLVISRGPIVCLPEAITAEEFQRRGRLLEQIAAQSEKVRETKSGYRLRLPSTRENIAALAQFIALERACCPFYTFALDFEPDGGPTWIEIAGPEGTKAYLSHFLTFAINYEPDGGPTLIEIASPEGTKAILDEMKGDCKCNWCDLIP